MTFDELFAARNLTRMVQGVKPGLPLKVAPQLLAVTDRANGHVFEWLEVDGNRELALIVGQDSPAKRVGQRGAKRKSATMLRSFESQTFTANKLRNLITGDGQVRDDMGRQFVMDQSQWFKQRQQNLRQTCVQRMLFQFELHFNEDGELLPSSSGATVSITVGIPAGQKGQLDILGDGAIIDASWAVAGTDIILHIDNIKDQMTQLGGWEITEAYYGKNIPGYIFGNTKAKEWINRNAALSAQAFATANSVPTGFQDLNWHKASNAFYIDAAGAKQQMLGDDEIVFTPSPSDTSWWKHAVGSEMVPTGLGQVGQDASAILGSVQEVMGEFSYATLATNPLSIEQFSGINFLPLISATKAVCKADVTP